MLVAMILFMLLIVTLVFMSMKQTYYLVEKDYYPKALEYQDRIDKTKNAELPGQRVEIENMGEEVVFVFPPFDPEGISGSITFYRPSDEGMDARFEIRADSALRQSCNVSGLPRGKYIVKLDYEADGKGYYQEETILIKMN